MTGEPFRPRPEPRPARVLSDGDRAFWTAQLRALTAHEADVLEAHLAAHFGERAASDLRAEARR